MEKYKLLKDLPGIKAGEILTYNQWIEVWRFNPNYHPEWFEEVKEQPTTKPVLELFKISENIYSDGRAAGKTYKVELIGSGYENKKPDIDKILKDLQMIKPIILENFSNVESLHTDLEKEMSGKIVRGILNGAEVSEQWINVNNAVIIAKKYMEKVKSSFSTLSDMEIEMIKAYRKMENRFYISSDVMPLSDTEKEIIEDLRKAKDAGISMNNFSMMRGIAGTAIQDGSNIFTSGATITGGTVKTSSETK